jgi:hypothetical protein
MPAASRTILLASVACTYGINLPIGVAGGTSIPTLSPPAKFMGDFSKPMAIPEAGIAKAIEVMQSGRLFRYIATDSQVASWPVPSTPSASTHAPQLSSSR